MNPFTRKLDYCSSISTEDGSVQSKQCKDLKVTNGTLTDNGSYFSLTTGSVGGGNSIFFEDSGNSIGNNQNADIYFDALDLVYINGTGQNLNIGVNWENLILQSSGVNWSDIIIQPSGVNWDSFEIQSDNINWENIEIQQQNINWTSVNKAMSASGINWQTIPNYAQGRMLYADTNNAIGVNWDTAPEEGTGTGTDDQKIDVFSLGGTTLSLSLESDGEATKEVDLSSLQDGIGTDDQTCAEVSGCVEGAITAVATADISDVSVTQTEFAELETIGATTISANQWSLVGGLAETLTATELNLLDGITILSGSNTGDDTTDYISEAELDSEAELETQLVGVTNVFTNNDGALNDDDITDDASTSLTDTADILYETELDSFSEIQSQIADKTLVNEEDAVAFDTSVSTPILTFSTSIKGGDNDRIYFGDTDDASIYFDATENDLIITTPSDTLQLITNEVKIVDPDGAGTPTVDLGADASIYYDGTDISIYNSGGSVNLIGTGDASIYFDDTSPITSDPCPDLLTAGRVPCMFYSSGGFFCQCNPSGVDYLINSTSTTCTY